ncbi:universal stress protein (plasmid) [Natrinema zhouii]|uniref:universal stress protein n=1 Tax=Natrinema zhouii TaxID=1710539 RepID=UPI001CFF80D7|nr:universal stress protein [Natrinema zhouii]UHQ98591.1 universal stress protein [Natrinema zhouii]
MQVLMPVDGEPERLDRQLQTLHDVIGVDDVAVTVLYVHEEIDTPPDEAGDTVIDSINENIESLQGVPETIERAKASLEEDGVSVDVVTTSGDPKTVIRDIAEDVEATVIIVAARKRSPVGKAVFGSVTQSVILEGDRPVLVANQ